MTSAELKHWRTTHHWTQRQAARLLGTSQVNLSRWESGRWVVPPTITILVTLLAHERNVRLVEDVLYTPLAI